MREKTRTEEMEKILITGAKGMLGLDLMDVFRESYDVYGRDIDDFDITKPKETMDAIGKMRPDVVIHAAAYTDVDGCESHGALAHSVNGGGTKNVASSCEELGARMVYISTDYVFDGTKPGAYTEEDPTCPINTYGRSKLEGEGWVSTMVGQFAIVRTAWLFGRRGKNFVGTVLKLAREKGALSVVNDQWGSPTYTPDLSRAIYVLVKKQCRGIYHITNAETCSWYEYAREILAMSGLDNIPVTAISSNQLQRAAKRPRNSVFDRGKFERETGYRMRSWREALRDYLKKEGCS